MNEVCGCEGCGGNCTAVIEGQLHHVRKQNAMMWGVLVDLSCDPHEYIRTLSVKALQQYNELKEMGNETV